MLLFESPGLPHDVGCSRPSPCPLSTALSRPTAVRSTRKASTYVRRSATLRNGSERQGRECCGNLMTPELRVLVFALSFSKHVRSAPSSESFEAIQPDLLIVGTKDRSMLSRVMRGSVANDVLRRMECDILVASPDIEAASALF